MSRQDNNTTPHMDVLWIAGPATSGKSRNNPGPVDDIRQDNAHRVGAPNHLQGSGETPMVGTTHTVQRFVPDPVAVKAIRTRLHRESHRFLHVHRTVQTLHTDALAVLVAEIIGEYTEHVTAERDALAEDLAWELNAARSASGGGEVR